VNIKTTYEKQQFLDQLTAIDRSEDSQWLNSVVQRKQIESEFHDDKVDRHGMSRGSKNLQEPKRGNKQFYSTVEKSKQHTLDWIAKHAPGKVVLDYACGQGELTLIAAQAGAEIAIGLDISRTSILNARKDAEEDGLSGNTFFLQSDCESTRLPDDCVDVMICSGMLHHLNVQEAYPEMCRILKPGGICLAIEALDYNPVIKLYRLLTPSLRTDWEKHHILSHKELKLSRKYFDVKKIKYWHLASVAAAPLRKTILFKPALAIGNFADSLLLKIPPICYLAWQFSFELHKPIESNASSKRIAISPNSTLAFEKVA